MIGERFQQQKLLINGLSMGMKDALLSPAVVGVDSERMVLLL